MKYKSNLTTDIVVFSSQEILLIKRMNDPFKDMWALPGGFVDENEVIKDCALRELFEETNIIKSDLLSELEFHSFYDDPNRDPRARYISFAFYCYVEKQKVNAVAKDDAKELRWFKLTELPKLAFDHAQIIQNIMDTKKPVTN